MNILIIKPSSMGDIIQANPTAVAIKKIFPDSRVSWLVFDMWSAIPALFPDVDEIIVWRRKGGIREYLRVIREVRKKSFDIVIDLQGLLRSAVIARFSGAPTVIGVPGMKEGSWMLVKESAPAWRSFNAVWRSLETVRHAAAPGGISTIDDVGVVDMNDLRKIFHIEVPVTAQEEVASLLRERGIGSSDAVIGIVPTARGKAKQWPSSSYVALIEMLQKKHVHVKIVLLDSAATALTYPLSNAVIDLGGVLTLHQLAAVLRRCSVVVGGDTGPMHLAAALGMPVVMMFGGSDVAETAPLSPLATILNKEFPCSPCRGAADCRVKGKKSKKKEHYPCLEAITPREVFEAIEKWIH
ncbi:MAG: glycosyltransferase family 9 protein [Elusimicrobia bacterium]|nr:glycosyltransferase family 9 protein [Elusimicrobiota bacterium]